MEELQDALGSPVNNLPPIVRRRVDALENLQKQYTGLLKQYQAEVRELERKYQKLYDPVYEKRATIIAGAYEPTDEEARVEKTEDDEGVKKREASPTDSEIKGIPQFWFEVLQNNSFVAQSIFEEDEDALSFLRDIRFAELEGSEGFSLTFHFAENPYFSNTTLVKTYFMEHDDVFGELEYSHATGTKVEWKAGKNLTVKQIKKKTKAKGKKPARVLTVEEPCDSFFAFFSPPALPAEGEEIEEEDAEIMEVDFDIGCVIKDKLIPHAIKWFTGEAAEYEGDDFGMGDDEDMYGDEDDEDDEDGEDDEDDDDEEEAPPKRGGKRGPGHAFAPPPGAKPGAPGQPQQPECKQQ